MKIAGTLFVCLLMACAAFAQTSADEEIQTVEELTIARDNGSGEIGEEQETFSPNDVPIHCSIVLSSRKAATVKMNIVFLKPGAAKSESKILTVSYKTNGKQNMVNFTGAPDKLWTVGNYRIDIFLDGILSTSKEFEVKAAAKIAAKPK